MEIKTLSRIVLTAMLLLFTTNAFSQSRITGKVVDSSENPIVGATVLVDGNAQKGVSTDVNGAFALSVPAGAKLNVSYIGYIPQSITVGNQTNLHIVLVEDTETIDDVVVIGYGVQRKSDVTGAIASVKSSDLANRSTSDAANALQGKAAGIQILNTSAAPGAGSTIRVRGYSSNSGSGLGPLLIVDGLKVDNIQYLDPSMIESMEVLKDAASAAIYGAQAGNGVVLITTKTGNKAKLGEGTIFYNYQYTRNSLGKTADVMNAKQYIAYNTDGKLLNDAVLANYDGTDTNWADVLFAPSATQRHTLGFQGGNDRGNYYLSINNVDDDGIVRGKKDVYKRLSAQINADYKIKNWLTVGTNTSLEKWSTQSVGQHSEFASVMGAVMVNDPLTPVYYDSYEDLPQDLKNAITGGKTVMQNAEGKYYAVSQYAQNDSGNPLLQRDKNNNKSEGINVRGTVYANLTPIKGLTYTSRLGYRIIQGYSSNYIFPFYLSSQCYENNYTVSANSSSSYYYQWENFANYNITLGKNNLGAMVGMSYVENNSRGVNGSITGPNPLTGYAENFHYLNYANSDATKSVSGMPSQSANISYYGRLSWSYDNRYNIQANFRADAYDSSKLSKDNRWGYFPSVSAGWTVSNEKFMQNVNKNSLSFLRVRASWGRNGNIAVLSGYPYSTSISLNSSVYQWNVEDKTGSYGSKPSGLANPDLTWETSEQFDLGLDARFLRDRLTLGVDYYKKTTKDLLVSISPVAEVGIGSTTINAGEVENSGLEIELGWKDNIGDFNYSVNGNISTLHNKVTYLDPSISRIQGSAYSSTSMTTQFEVGQPVWYMRGFKYLGVNKDDGTPIYEDVDKSGSITDDDLTYIGCGIPDFTYGVTINLAYKNFDFTLFGTGVSGNQIFSCVHRVDRPLNNTLAYFYENGWTESNKNASMPSAASTVTDTKFWSSSANVFNGSFFKIKQIQLGYTIPQKLTKKVAISNLRVYASLDDYFTFSNYPGFDPETASSGSTSALGMDKGSYPTSKKIVFGVNVSF